MTTIVVHVGKLFAQARQLSIPGREAAWVAKKLYTLFKAGKLVGFSYSSSGEWEKIVVREVPQKLQIRGVPLHIADKISAEFWRQLSRS